MSELRTILLAIGVSDAKMEEGSMRVDANVSVRPARRHVLGTRCEIKNLNSLRSLGRAIEYEARRQVELIDAGERVRQETRHWDEDDGRTRPGRSKEEAEDYRYFPEPDLVPLTPGAAQIEAIDRWLPALPSDRRAHLAVIAGVAPTAVATAVDRDLDGLAIRAIEAGGDAGRVLTHVDNNLAVEGAQDVNPDHLAEFDADGGRGRGHGDSGQTGVGRHGRDGARSAGARG